jgi:hypothetical protein
MQTLMCYQTALSTECLITYCAAIRAITAMYALMRHHMALLTECLITYCTAIRAITAMYTLMFYQSALCTECLITYCAPIRVIKTMYIMGRSAFTTVHMKFFIPSTLLKTQRLNIRIYCDRKTIIFIAMYTLNKSIKICCMISKVCAYWSLPSKWINTLRLEADQDDVSTCNYTKAKAHCPIWLMQKMIQKLTIRNI